MMTAATKMANMMMTPAMAATMTIIMMTMTVMEVEVAACSALMTSGVAATALQRTTPVIIMTRMAAPVHFQRKHRRRPATVSQLLLATIIMMILTSARLVGSAPPLRLAALSPVSIKRPTCPRSVPQARGLRRPVRRAGLPELAARRALRNLLRDRLGEPRPALPRLLPLLHLLPLMKFCVAIIRQPSS